LKDLLSLIHLLTIKKQKKIMVYHWHYRTGKKLNLEKSLIILILILFWKILIIKFLVVVKTIMLQPQHVEAQKIV